MLSGINRLFPLPTIVIDFNVYYTVPYTTLSRKLNTYSPYISHHNCTHPTKYRAIHFLFNAVFLPCSVPAAVPSEISIPSILFCHAVCFAVFVVIEPQFAQQAVACASFFSFVEIKSCIFHILCNFTRCPLLPFLNFSPLIYLLFLFPFCAILSMKFVLLKEAK